MTIPLSSSPTTTKQPYVVFTVADQQNFPYALTMLKSLYHFHKDWPVILYTNETDPTKLKALPKTVTVEDLTPYLEDPFFFYRATPILAEPLLATYELVIKLDADQLILGDLSYIVETKDYDIGTVLNANRFDPQYFGWVELSRIGIMPIEYFNCGLVAMRSQKFVHTWLVDCFSPQFDRMQYKEQDILNILCYFANYNIRCFDHGDGVKKYNAWHGLIAKGETPTAVLRGKEIVIPKGKGDTPYPPVDMSLKILHLGGGNGAPKDNWASHFSPEVMTRIEEIIR